MMAKLKMDCSRELLLKPKDLAIAHNELVAKISMLDSSEEIAKKENRFPAGAGPHGIRRTGKIRV